MFDVIMNENESQQLIMNENESQQSNHTHITIQNYGISPYILQYV